MSEAPRTILLDGVPGCMALDGECLWCQVGGRILAWDMSRRLAHTAVVTPQSGAPVRRLAAGGGRLFALLQDGVLWVLVGAPGRGSWTATQGGGATADIEVRGDDLYVLSGGMLSRAKCNAEGIIERLDVWYPGAQVHRVAAVGPWLVAWGPRALWVVRFEPSGVRLVFEATDSFPLPLDFAWRPGELVVADHLAGLVPLRDNGRGALERGTPYPEVLHPYSVASYAGDWAVATERGALRCDSEGVAPLPVPAEHVLALRGTSLGLLCVQPSQLLLLREGGEVAVRLGGFAYDAAEGDGIVVCATEHAVHLLRPDGTSLRRIESGGALPGHPRTVLHCGERIWIGTTEALVALAPDGKVLYLLRGSGEPVSLAAGEPDVVYWGCGRTLRVVCSGTEPHVVREMALGVYAHALAASGTRLLMASGPGGALWGCLDRPGSLAPLPEVEYATDVAIEGDVAAVATVRGLSIFGWSDGTPRLRFRVQDAADLCTCALRGSTVWYATGRSLHRIDLGAAEGPTAPPRELPFAPRRLHALSDGVLAVGSGGALMEADDV